MNDAKNWDQAGHVVNKLEDLRQRLQRGPEARSDLLGHIRRAESDLKDTGVSEAEVVTARLKDAQVELAKASAAVENVERDVIVNEYRKAVEVRDQWLNRVGVLEVRVSQLGGHSS